MGMKQHRAMDDAIRRKFAAERECIDLDERIKVLKKMRREANKRLGEALKDIEELAAKPFKQ
jgi:hypothetical protein